MPPTEPTMLCNGLAGCGQVPLLPLLIITLIAGAVLLLAHRVRSKERYTP